MQTSVHKAIHFLKLAIKVRSIWVTLCELLAC